MTDSSRCSISRQAVFNTSGEIFGYDFLYPNSNFCDDVPYNRLNILENIFRDTDVKKMLGHYPSFISIDRTTLFSDFIETLPKQYTLALSCEIEVTDQTIIRIDELHDQGYRFALDDINTDPSRLSSVSLLFPYIDYVKMDLEGLDESGILNTLSRLKHYNFTFLAKNVSDIKTYTYYQSHGFSLFEGNFYQNPIIVENKRIEPLTAKVLELINLLHQDNPISDIENGFIQNPELLFNLLRYMNSASFSFSGDIKSIRQTITLLGRKQLLSWLGMFLYSNKHNRPFGTALLKSALFRAKMMEDLSVYYAKNQPKESAFFVGILSCIDTYLQIPLENLIQNIRLDTVVRDALMHESGELGILLKHVKELEKGNVNPAISENSALRENLPSIISEAHAFADRSSILF